MTCGTKITTGGCPNASCAASPFGITIIVPKVIGGCRCDQLERRVQDLEAEVARLKIPPVAAPNLFAPIMPLGFTTTTSLMG